MWMSVSHGECIFFLPRHLLSGSLGQELMYQVVEICEGQNPAW